jgi:Ca2+/Na+ antiporter
VFANISDYFASLHWPAKGETMFQYVQDFLGSAYIEVIIFFLLIAYFVANRKDQHAVKSGLNLLRVIILLIIFLYFIWSWATLIPPSLRALSVLGMFIINFYFLYCLVLMRVERPYRVALEAMGRDPEKPGIFRDIWSYGKRFYNYYYIFQSLFSGTNPLHFLSNITSDRVQDDIRNTLRQMGVEKQLISLKVMVGFMKSRLASDETLPADFKEVMGSSIDDLAKHPWIEEQVNEFLRIATEAPEDLHFSEWQAFFKKAVTEKK